MGLCWVVETHPTSHPPCTDFLPRPWRVWLVSSARMEAAPEIKQQRMFHKTPQHPGVCVCVSTHGASILHRYGCTHTMAQQHWVRGKSNFRRNPAQELQSFVVPLCGEAWVVPVMDDGDNGNDTEKADDMTKMRLKDHDDNHKGAGFI